MDNLPGQLTHKLSITISMETYLDMLSFCEETGLSKTAAVERCIRSYIDDFYRKTGVERRRIVITRDVIAPDLTDEYARIFEAFGLYREPTLPEKRTIDKWIREYKMPLDVIIEACNRTLLQSRRKNQALSINYTDSIISRWHREGVRDINGVIELDERYREEIVTISVSKKLGITTLSSKETDTVRGWIREYDMPANMIMEACERTLRKAKTPNIRYADTIITSWHKKGIRCMDDVVKNDRMYFSSKRTSEDKS